MNDSINVTPIISKKRKDENIEINETETLLMKRMRIPSTENVFFFNFVLKTFFR